MIDTITDYLGSELIIGHLENGLSALIIFFIGLLLARKISSAFKKQKLGTKAIDPKIRPILSSILYYVLIALAIYAALTTLGVPTASLLAIFGAAGLAVALAIKDTLSDIAAAIMLITHRDLDIGDYIETPDISGKLLEIGLFVTRLEGSDGIHHYIPNHLLWNKQIKNFAHHQARRLSFTLHIQPDRPLRDIQTLILSNLREFPHLQTHISEPNCLVTDITPTAIAMTIYAWLPQEDWGHNSSELRISLSEALDTASIGYTNLPQMVIKNN